MASGVKCHQSCVDAFNELKMKKNHRYILFYIKDESEIQILEKGERSATYSEFYDKLVEAMDDGAGRYAVYDFESEGKIPTLVFVVWTPSNIGVRSRMLYASSKDAIKRKLVGIKRELQANDLDEITEEEIRKKAEG